RPLRPGARTNASRVPGLARPGTRRFTDVPGAAGSPGVAANRESKAWRDIRAVTIRGEKRGREERGSISNIANLQIVIFELRALSSLSNSSRNEYRVRTRV